MKYKTLIALAFFVGYFANDLTRLSGVSINANATVAGMPYWALQADPDFRRAVMSVAEEECRTDINSTATKTWFYCGSASKFKPR